MEQIVHELMRGLNNSTIENAPSLILEALKYYE